MGQQTLSVTKYKDFLRAVASLLLLLKIAADAAN